ncbi:Glutamate--tRNA ligase [uncultured archaeon]|nr:Glutamate--tRNA ligase [uncultured archaeon]
MSLENDEIKKLVRKFALKNALDHGKAIEGAVVSRMIFVDPSFKANMKALSEVIREQVDEVNRLDRASLEKEFAQYAGEFKAAEEKKAETSSKHDFSVDGAEKGNFVTRFPPEPGGYMHIGHTKAVFIEDVLRKKYDGKLVLYFDDTNPDNERQEFVDSFHEDLDWLGITFDREYYASDHMQLIYEHAKRAIGLGKAYVCTCRRETIGKNRLEGTACEHKAQSAEKNAELWQMMLDGKLGDNEAILRLNSDIKAVNTTMRDPTLFRIKRAKHYRQQEKYIVWPTYDFSAPIIDSVEGVTDVLRSKEYEMRDELYFAVLDILGLRKPRITSFARLDISNNVTSKRKVRALIAENKIGGWDDPRLVTIRALRRRGITVEAIRELALSTGMGKAESSISIDVLLNMNRRIIDPVAKHLFFVSGPVKVVISDEGERDAKLRLHPVKDIGFRTYETWDEFYISREDADALEVGDTARLKDLMAIKIVSKDEKAVHAKIFQSQEGRIVQWVSGRDYVECTVLVPGTPLDDKENFREDSLKTVDGYAEDYVEKLEEHETVQFERFGYCTLDDKEAMRFVFVSK